jgi:hypothetical protein
MTIEEDTQYPIVNLYDHEILEAEKVLEALGKKQRTSQNLESFRKEIVERFAEIGLVVFAKVYNTTEDGVYAFEVEIRGRTEELNWDPDQQVHEVRTDILDLLPNSEKGTWIKSGSGLEIPKHKH